MFVSKLKLLRMGSIEKEKEIITLGGGGEVNEPPSFSLGEAKWCWGIWGRWAGGYVCSTNSLTPTTMTTTMTITMAPYPIPSTSLHTSIGSTGHVAAPLSLPTGNNIVTNSAPFHFFQLFSSSIAAIIGSAGHANACTFRTPLYSIVH